MIGPNDNSSGSAEGLGALALMRSLEQQIAHAQGTPPDEAQQLYYHAMEAPTDEEQFALIQQALKLDPGNVDALLMVLRLRPLNRDDEIEVLRKVVALAEQRLGPEAFKEFAGAFWGFTETRPYMRARAQLADDLRCAGRIEEAIVEWEAMLKLNPNDNQGTRYALLTAYLGRNRLDDAARLFEKFDECPWSTLFAWSRVLHQWLTGDTAGAKEALAVARKQNGQTEAFLKGHKRLPRHLPEAYSPGSKEEAQCFAEALQTLWQSHPKALAWLTEQQSGPRGKKG
jgi:tetratricopeptide (TPR) repeat protein